MGPNLRLWLIASLTALNELARAASMGSYNGLAKRQGDINVMSLTFNPIDDLVTCQPATFQWFYVGPAINMTLSITNTIAPLPAQGTTTSGSTTTPTPPTNARRQTGSNAVDMIISTKVNPDSDTRTFQWPSVNVTSGIYQLRATIASQGFVSRSAPFNVQQGSDISCLQSPSSTTTTGGNGGVASNTGVNAPGPVSAISKSLKTGTIVGIVIGVLAILIAVLLAYLRIRSKAKGKGGFGAGRFNPRKWNGLSSVDSRNALGGQSHNHNHSHDMGPPLASNKRRNYSRGSSLGTVVGDGFANNSEEKIGSGGQYNYSRKNSVASVVQGNESRDMALATLPTLHHHRDRDDHHHHSNVNRNGGAAGATGNANVGRRTSLDRKSAKSRSQPYLPPIESDGATISRSSSVGNGYSEFYASSHTQEQANPNEPMSPDQKKANRQSFGRKRKPVPAYDPTGDSEVASVPTSPIPRHSPIPPAEYYEFGGGYHHGSPQLGGAGDLTASSTPTASALGHYTTRNNAAAGGQQEEVAGTQEGLVHKNSFGPGKPLHYLMPDLPMSAQQQPAYGSYSSHSSQR